MRGFGRLEIQRTEALLSHELEWGDHACLQRYGGAAIRGDESAHRWWLESPANEPLNLSLPGKFPRAAQQHVAARAQLRTASAADPGRKHAACAASSGSRRTPSEARALHSDRERRAAAGLDDEVEVIAWNRDVHARRRPRRTWPCSRACRSARTAQGPDLAPRLNVMPTGWRPSSQGRRTCGTPGGETLPSFRLRPAPGPLSAPAVPSRQPRLDRVWSKVHPR